MKNEKTTKNVELSKAKATFQAAYSIHGRGVGKLELDKAVKSKEFRNAAKKLVEKIHVTYAKKANAGG